MEVTPQAIYQQTLDKQRVVIIGSSKSVIGKFIQHVLKFHHRKFDYIIDKQISEPLTKSEAPVVFIEASEQHVTGFHHHMIVFSAVDLNVNQLTAICDATPKSGIIFYPETNSTIKSVAGKERTDTLSIPYKEYAHEKSGNSISLISSKKVKVPVTFSDAQHLEAASAAKEVLKKVGITSDQFYQAISSF